MRRVVIFRHGIVINRWFMKPLERYLRRHGFEVLTGLIEAPGACVNHDVVEPFPGPLSRLFVRQVIRGTGSLILALTIEDHRWGVRRKRDIALVSVGDELGELQQAGLTGRFPMGWFEADRGQNGV